MLTSRKGSKLKLEKFVLHTEFKGSPEYAPPYVFYHTSFRCYVSFSLPVPSNLSIFLGQYGTVTYSVLV
jgi:hypothetical protein